MAKNANLHSAKSAKNDEFYTQITDIEKELKHYRHHFKDKTVFCNCDDPMESNFWQYFSLNFDRLQLRRLIATHYETDKPSYVLEMWRDDAGVHTDIKQLKQNGDFRSPECVELLKRSDIVVTNPPFSLFREYVAQLMEYDKKFVIIGNKNAITYKEFFPLLKENKAWIGYNAVHEFGQPDGTMRKFGNIGWYTNLDIKKRHEPLILCQPYNPTTMPRYDNYDAINIDKVADIPYDYCESWGVPAETMERLEKDEWETVRTDTDGYVWVIPTAGTDLRRMLSEHRDDYKDAIEAVLNDAIYCSGQIGVPITYLDSHNPDEMDIIRFRKGDDGQDLYYSCSQSDNVERERERERDGSRTSESSSAESSEVLQRDNGCADNVSRQLQSGTNDTHRGNRIGGQGLLNGSVESGEQNCAADGECNPSVQTSVCSIKYCNGMMGVPITFLDSYSLDQFAIIGCADANIVPDGWKGASARFVEEYYAQGNTGQYHVGNRLACYFTADGQAKVPYKRILIQKEL